MSVQPGWYDAGVPGRQRWWDGARWTEHERSVGSAPAAPPMGWYPVPETADVRWWDGQAWTPHRLRDGRPRADPFAVEPAATGRVLGILFLVLGALQLLLALVSRQPAFWATPILFIALGTVWLIGAAQTARLRRTPPPRTAAVLDPAARPLPGEVEGAGAGWYPMTGQVTRWWTGARWTWYVGTRVGVRPGHSGPRGYLISVILGWIVAGLGGLVAIGGIVLVAVLGADPVVVFIAVVMIIAGVLFAGVGAFVLVLTRARRHGMLLPTSPPPLR